MELLYSQMSNAPYWDKPSGTSLVHPKAPTTGPSLNYIWQRNIHYGFLSAMFTPLHNSTTVQKVLCNQSSHYAEIQWCCAPQLSSETETSIAFLCQQFSTHYTAVRIKNCLKSTSAIKVATTQKYGWFLLRKGSHHMQPPKINVFYCQQRRMEHKVSPWRMHCIYCGMPKCTSQAKATSISKKNQASSISHFLSYTGLKASVS